MSKERRLGRGLEALLGRVAQVKENIAADKPDADNDVGSAPGIGSGIGPSDHMQPMGGDTQPATEKPVEIFQNQSSPEPSALPPEQPAPVGELKSEQQSMHNDSGIVQPSNTAQPATKPAKHGDGRSDHDVVQVNIALIEANPFQPRKDFDDASMAELAESITAHGLLQPIVARRIDDVYQLIAGERRLRAAQKAGWDEVPVRVIETDERGAAELAIVENLQRKDLNALEKAASFRRYIKQHRCTQEQLALRLRIDRSTIANFMRLLELPEPVQQSLAAGKISQGHARALLPLGEEREQIAFCRRIEREGLSVRKTESLVQEAIKTADAEPLSLVSRDGHCSKSENTKEHLSALEQEFRLGLGTKVKITQGKGGSGKLVIHFNNHDEFNRVKDHILGSTQPQAKAG